MRKNVNADDFEGKKVLLANRISGFIRKRYRSNVPFRAKIRKRTFFLSVIVQCDKSSTSVNIRVNITFC